MPTEASLAAVHMPKDPHIDIVDARGVNAAHAPTETTADLLHARSR